MMQHFNYSLTELEQMLPWEREVYLILLNEFIEEKAKTEQRSMQNGATKSRFPPDVSCHARMAANTQPTRPSGQLWSPSIVWGTPCETMQASDYVAETLKGACGKPSGPTVGMLHSDLPRPR